jgi:hypothetical protein
MHGHLVSLFSQTSSAIARSPRPKPAVDRLWSFWYLMVPLYKDKEAAFLEFSQIREVLNERSLRSSGHSNTALTHGFTSRLEL